MKLLILLSGPIAVGKTSIAEELVQHHQFRRISTRDFLLDAATRKGLSSDRASLQQLGDDFDIRTDCRWLVDEVAAVQISNAPNVEYWLVDSVRKKEQVQNFRSRYGSRCVHVFLTGSEVLLQERYQSRLAINKENADQTPYIAAIAHPNELCSRRLVEIADLTIDVSGRTSGEIAMKIITYSSSRGARCERL